jgi:D-glycero-D-manno-heptose 1,7-bisphosphate phosphatase
VFLDRDGTVNVDTHYVRRPEEVSLIAGAAEAIAQLNRAGVPVIVVSNQSGIGRGILTHADYEQVRGRLDVLLASHSAHIDASYICPHAPDPGTNQPVCECRKPGTLLFRSAAMEHAIDLARSAFIGDRWRDIAPALAFHARGIMVPSPTTPPADFARASREMHVERTLGAAVEHLLDDWRTKVRGS